MQSKIDVDYFSFSKTSKVVRRISGLWPYFELLMNFEGNYNNKFAQFT